MKKQDVVAVVLGFVTALLLLGWTQQLPAPSGYIQRPISSRGFSSGVSVWDAGEGEPTSLRNGEVGVEVTPGGGTDPVVKLSNGSSWSAVPSFGDDWDLGSNDLDVTALTAETITLDDSSVVSGWLVASGTLSAAQVQSLNGTPVEVIAAPAAGVAVVVESAQFMLDYNSAAYDGDGAGEDLALIYAAGSTLLVCDNATCLDVDATADQFGVVSSQATDLGIDLAAATAVQAKILAGEIFAAAGNSPIHYSIRYRLVTVDLS